jgi:hypothetical protein
MASTYSDRLKLELMETGANANTWGNNTNNNLQTVDAFSAGYLSKNVGGSSNVTLTTANASATAEASNKVLDLNGTLTGNITVFVPQVENNYLVYNNTSGSFTLDVAATGGTGTSISQGGYAWIYCDGTNVQLAELGTNASTISTGTLDNARLNSNVVVFDSGTSMLFQQSTAPTGWTKQTSHDNKALRVVTGSVSSGGSNTFTDAFNATKTVSGTTGGTGVTITGSTAGHVLTQAQLPSYTLTPQQRAKTEDKGPLNRGSSSGGGASYEFLDIPSGGSDQAHSHSAGTLAGSSHTHSFSDTFNLDVQYVDFIIANKD